MGNSIYKEEIQHSFDELINKINKIATEYIIKQNYSDMKQILDKNKYDEILDLVTTILSKNINTDDIELLVSQLYSSELDSRNTHLKKCRKIAVFYLKIAHLFDSIMMAINPHMSVDEVLDTEIKSSSNIKHESSIKRDSSIKRESKIKNVNMCSRRLNALINANVKLGKPNEISLKSPACNIESLFSHTLSEEDGLPELETLYYDEYDFDSGTFNKMSDKMKREYKKDVELFYRVFSAKPDKVERFSDIKISDIIERDYNTICNSTDEYIYVNRRKKPYRMEKERLFKKYADNVKSMTVFIHKREQELLYILNQVFKKDEITNEYNISQTIHSYTLDKLIDDARRSIVSFYSKCEEFYVEGVQIYDAIVQNQIKYTTIKQIKNSNVLLEKMVNDNDNVNNNDNVNDDDSDDDDYAGEEYNINDNNNIYEDEEYYKKQSDYSVNEGDIEEERTEV